MPIPILGEQQPSLEMGMSEVFDNLRNQAKINLPMSCGSNFNYKDIYGNYVKDGVVTVYVIIEYKDRSTIMTISSMSINLLESDVRLEPSKSTYNGITPRLRVRNGINFPERYEQ